MADPDDGGRHGHAPVERRTGSTVKVIAVGTGQAVADVLVSPETDEGC